MVDNYFCYLCQPWAATWTWGQWGDGDCSIDMPDHPQAFLSPCLWISWFTEGIAQNFMTLFLNTNSAASVSYLCDHDDILAISSLFSYHFASVLADSASHRLVKSSSSATSKTQPCKFCLDFFKKYLLVLKGAHLKTINTKFQLLTAEGSIFLVMGMRCESCIRFLLLYRVWFCLNMVNACAFINYKFLLAIFILRQKPGMGRQIFSHSFPALW